jgi:hypothetical protein
MPGLQTTEKILSFGFTRLKKKRKFFLIYKEIQKGSGTCKVKYNLRPPHRAKYLSITSYIRTLHLTPPEFPHSWGKFSSFFYSVHCLNKSNRYEEISSCNRTSGISSQTTKSLNKYDFAHDIYKVFNILIYNIFTRFYISGSELNMFIVYTRCLMLKVRDSQMHGKWKKTIPAIKTATLRLKLSHILLLLLVTVKTEISA